MAETMPLLSKISSPRSLPTSEGIETRAVVERKNHGN